MKHAKRVQRDGSKTAVKNQSKTAWPETVATAAATETRRESPAFSLCFIKAVAVLSQMVGDEQARRDRSKEDCTRLRVMESATKVLLEQGTALVCDVPYSGLGAESSFQPFGPMDPTHEVQMARHHIWDVWKQCQTQKADDVLGGHLPALHHCIRHHPGLKTESWALEGMGAGSNELIGLMSATSSGQWDGNKLTGAKLWFAWKLQAAHSGPFDRFLSLLADAEGIFKNEPNAAKVASAIEKILNGLYVIQDVRRWLDNI